MGKVEVYVDGASLGNPGPGGYAVLIKTGEEEVVLKGGEKETTNNRMELRAVIEALSYFKEPTELVIYSDSEYVIKGVTKWRKIWEKNNFKRANKKPLKNKDLWDELFKKQDFHKVFFVKIPAHKGHPENEKVDKIAKEEAKKWKKSF